MPTVAQPIENLLRASAASAPFREAVQSLERGAPQSLIRFTAGVPPIKVLRVLAKLLEIEPDLEVRNAEVVGVSGCSDFAGTLAVNDGERLYDFCWDCRWRAEQEGYITWYGQPDQARAAREFGYQCFQRFVRTR
jgi:hypothetical protein